MCWRSRVHLADIVATDSWLLVPVKSLTCGKSRLAGHLTPSERVALNVYLLEKTLALAARFPGKSKTLVVSGCDQVLRTSGSLGVHTLTQEGVGMNEAVEQGFRSLRGGENRSVIVLPCDLPFAKESDLAALLPQDEHEVVLATDRAGQGTNGLGLSSKARFRFRYGAQSKQHHVLETVAGGGVCRVLARNSLEFDLDEVEDYLEWAGASSGPTGGPRQKFFASGGGLGSFLHT